MARGGRKKAAEEVLKADEPENPFTAPGFIASAGVLALILVIGVFVVLSSRHSAAVTDTSPVAVSSTAPVPQTGSTVAPASASCPRLKDTSQNVSAAGSAADVNWQVTGAVELPYSASAGPAVVDGDVARCYARTPLGALLALAQISMRSANTDGWRSVIEQQVMPGTGRDLFEQQVAAGMDSQAGSPPNAAELAQYAGFTFMSYTPDSAVVQFALSFPGGELRAVVLTAVWSGGDWRLQVLDDGSQSAGVTSPDNLDGFTPWSAG